MKRYEQHPSRDFSSSRRFALIAAALVLFLFVGVIAAQAQTYQVLYRFTGGADGYYPTSGVVFDRAGNLYGGVSYGGNYTSSCDYEGRQTGCGLIYKMSHHGSGWTFNLLASFNGANGYNPAQLITVAPDGSLYGTTLAGGAGDCNSSGPGCGAVFRLQPPATFCASVSCPWTVTDPHLFVGPPKDGSFPNGGSLARDSSGNLYGTTEFGGLYGAGIVYELSPTSNGWTMSVLYNFSGGLGDGANPPSGVVFDTAGNLYGVTFEGGAEDSGTVYQLAHTESGWTEHVLYSFTGQTDGGDPWGQPVIDSSGNLYGTTRSFGFNSGGTVWELSPENGNWNFSVLYGLTGGSFGGPIEALLMDGAGNLYGAAVNDGAHQYGSVFKLSPSNGGWNYTDLYDFTGGSDGGLPYSGVSMDSAGNLFGITDVGGSSGQGCSAGSGCGVVWEIMP